MSLARVFADLCGEVAELSARIGRRVQLDPRQVTDRRDALTLRRPGLWSANRSCRMVRAADGWIAVNLPRESDLWAVPAWTGCALDAEPWSAVRQAARARPWRDLVEGARRLGLPVCGVGEISAESLDAPLERLSAVAPRPRSGPPTVIDLTSLWAGPLCGAILAQAGCRVTKLESRGRPDPARTGAPDFYRRLNAGKAEAALDFADPADRARLADAITGADVVITSARPRAFDQLRVTPEAMAARNPGLAWVAITGYGWRGEAADRVAFGDDAAAAGGLVRRTPAGEPRFLGDALADPLTGLAAAIAAMRALLRGGGMLADVAMARTAAGAAHRMSLFA